MATITQGDFSIFGFFETRESGRWGEGGAKGTGTPSHFVPSGAPNVPGFFNINQFVFTGKPATESGGSFDFNHWDLVQARQLADIRPDYHMVKNYKFLGRLDTMVLKDADFFAFYRPWYDAFGSIKKSGGRAEPNRDWEDYTQHELQQEYFRDDLREYYAQLNFTDNFSMRVGKQEIIWSEADALSGTEVTNPVDTRYHWLHFESPENQRKNIRMVKFNYILPDFLKTANNELEAIWIPGDYQGDTIVANTNDARSPWIAPGPLTADIGNKGVYNAEGQPVRDQTFADDPAVIYDSLNSPAAPTPLLAQQNVIFNSRRPSNSIDNSEFGVRYSALLPIGNGLQASLIYLYEARYSEIGLCTACPQQFGVMRGPLAIFGAPVLPPGVTARVPFTFITPGIWLGTGVFDHGRPHNGATLGTLRIMLSENYRRNHFFGLTGTYYDKDLTDIVYRYDTLFAPKVAINIGNPAANQGQRGPALGTSSVAWTELTRFIIAGDRPTYIPWLSKQHTFLTFQYVNTWYPDRPKNAVPSFADFAGKVREDSNFGFLAATNWLLNGQLTSTNVLSWDIDDNVGALSSTNVYRYSRNVLFGLNAQWYLGQSGRFTDPFAESRGQRINELEATISYEI